MFDKTYTYDALLPFLVEQIAEEFEIEILSEKRSFEIAVKIETNEIDVRNLYIFSIIAIKFLLFEYLINLCEVIDVWSVL